MAHSQFAIGRRRVLLLAAWLAAVVIFAMQWFVYDAARGNADPFRYYLWWSCYTWGILTPVVVTFSYHKPIKVVTWKRVLPLHVGASFVLVASEISIEAMGAVQLYRMRDEAHRRELRSSNLEAELGAAQLEVLRAQIHPHFLFNTLQAATTLIHEDPDGAEDILLRLSELLRVAVHESHIQEVPLEVLDLYTGIQARRVGDRLRFEVAIDQNVRDCMVPALILQPLIENAIRHGIGRHKGSDTVSIRGFREGEFLQLEVRNLNSRLEDKSALSEECGVGLANTRARLEQLYGNQHEFGLRNLEPTGVSAELSIPLRPAPVLIEEASR